MYLSVFAARHFYTGPTDCGGLCLVRRTCLIASIQRRAVLSIQTGRAINVLFEVLSALKLKRMHWPTQQSFYSKTILDFMKTRVCSLVYTLAVCLHGDCP